MKATTRFFPSASSPPWLEAPSASSWPLTTSSPTATTGRWFWVVRSFMPRNFVRGYSSSPTMIRRLSTYSTVPAFFA